jgi:hypothetical protein
MGDGKGRAPRSDSARRCSPPGSLRLATARGEYELHRDRWLVAAARVLERHPRERLAEALAYMVTDEILGSRTLTMAGFAKVADQLIARA